MKLVEINPSSRQNFKNTWLCEMPSGSGTFETFDVLTYSISDFLKHGIAPEQISGSLNRIIAGDNHFYWYHDNNSILIATELHRKPEGLVVSLTGKNPKLKGKPPFTSQLYSDILKHSDKSIRILSDTQLSDEGFSMWKRMLSLGHKISVYDAENPGKTFKSFEKQSDFDEYFKDDDTDFMRYQFILSENILDFCSVRASFNLRLHRENSNLSLE